MMENPLHDRLPEEDEFLTYAKEAILDPALVDEVLALLRVLKNLRLLDAFGVSLESEHGTEAIVFHLCAEEDCPIPMFAVYTRAPEGMDA